MGRSRQGYDAALKTIGAAISALSLSACAAVGETDGLMASGVRAGMSRDQVVGQLGQPGTKSFMGETEALQYCTTGFSRDRYWTIWLEAGVVVGVNSNTNALTAGYCGSNFPKVDWASAPSSRR